jgi:hypothetical protein
MTPITLQQISELVWAGFGGDGRNAGYVRLGRKVPGLLAGTSEYDAATSALVEAAGGTVGTVVGTDAGAYRMSVPAGAQVVATTATAREIADRTLLGDVPVTPGSLLDSYLERPSLAIGMPVDRWPVAETIAGWWSPVPGKDAVAVLYAGRGYASGDAVVWVAADGVLLTGALVVNGVHPASWSGSLDGWHAACARLADLHPATVLPGHGWPGDESIVITMRDYVEHLRTEAEIRWRKGMPVQEAAADLPLGRWADWERPEHLAITLATAYREFGATDERTVAETLTMVAELAAGVGPGPKPARSAPAERVDPPAGPPVEVDTPVDVPEPPGVEIPATALVEHPSVPIGWTAVHGVLPERHREMAVLRCAWVCSASYQWDHHRPLALAAGLSDVEIDLLSQPIDVGVWTPEERAVLSAVDELNVDASVSDQTWDTLADAFGEEGLVELVTLIGEYRRVSSRLTDWGGALEHSIDHAQLPSGWRRFTPTPRTEEVPVPGQPVAEEPAVTRGLSAAENYGRHSMANASGPSVGDLVRSVRPDSPQ